MIINKSTMNLFVDTKEYLFGWWLAENNLLYVDEKLRNSGYNGLGKIINTPNKDIETLLNELNIPSIKRQPFRNAVNSLKSKANENINSSNGNKNYEKLDTIHTKSDSKDKTGSSINNACCSENKEAKFDNVLVVSNEHTLKPPYVILVGIQDYSKSKPVGKWINLDGVNKDIENMIHLWSSIYLWL